MGLKQWAASFVIEKVTLTDGNGLYADAVVTFEQSTEPSIAKAILASPKWYVVKKERHRDVQD